MASAGNGAETQARVKAVSNQMPSEPASTRRVRQNRRVASARATPTHRMGHPVCGTYSNGPLAVALNSCLVRLHAMVETPPRAAAKAIEIREVEAGWLAPCVSVGTGDRTRIRSAGLKFADAIRGVVQGRSVARARLGMT